MVNSTAAGRACARSAETAARHMAGKDKAERRHGATSAAYFRLAGAVADRGDMTPRALHMLAASLRCFGPSGAAEATQLTAARFTSVRRGHALSEVPAEALNITDACAKVRPASRLSG